MKKLLVVLLFLHATVFAGGSSKSYSLYKEVDTSKYATADYTGNHNSSGTLTLRFPSSKVIKIKKTYLSPEACFSDAVKICAYDLEDDKKTVCQKEFEKSSSLSYDKCQREQQRRNFENWPGKQSSSIPEVNCEKARPTESDLKSCMSNSKITYRDFGDETEFSILNFGVASCTCKRE